MGGDPEKPHLIDWSLLYSVDMQIDKDDRGRYSKLPTFTERITDTVGYCGMF